MITYNFPFEDEGYTPPTGSGSYSFDMRDEIYLPPPPPDPLPAYYGFDFEDDGYVPPSGAGSFSFDFSKDVSGCEDEWIESEYDQWPPDPDIAWGECEDPFTYLKQIWTDQNYVYAATTDGLNIIDMVSEQAYAHVSYEAGFNSVWADEDNVYVATPDDGVKYLEKACISGSVADPYELVVCLKDYLNEPDLLSDKVRYLHGNNGHMIFSTASGVNYRGPDVYYQRAEGITDLSRKVFITPSGRMYYLTWDGSVWKVNIKYADNQDWTEPDKTYQTGTFLINGGVDILDIFVTEGTSDTGVSNTIFVATTSGIFLIDEETNEGATYYTV